jgi:hypothetical protein
MATPAQANVTGGLTIGAGGQKDEDAERDESDRANKRRRRGSGANQAANPPPNNNSAANDRAAPPQSPHSPNAPIPAPAPPPMNISGQRSGAPPQNYPPNSDVFVRGCWSAYDVRRISPTNPWPQLEQESTEAVPEV